MNKGVPIYSMLNKDKKTAYTLIRDAGTRSVKQSLSQSLWAATWTQIGLVIWDTLYNSPAPRSGWSGVALLQ